MRKTLSSLIALMLLLALMLTSCGSLFGGEGPDNGGNGTTDDTPDTEGENKPGNTQTSTTYSQIVVQDMRLDVATIRSGVFEILGVINMVTPSDPADDREIVIGATERPISLAAYAELQRLIAADGKSDIGYIIYSDGESLTVYWTSTELEKIALSDFYKECIEARRLDVEEGTILYNVYSSKEIEQEALWLDIKAEAPEDLYNALRRLNTFYEGDKMCEWMANLWDEDVGGFYYSNSARDNEPFLPDLESTNQLTNWLQANGACAGYNNQVNNMFPNDLKMKIVDFAKSTQSPNDGYFYHPQWPQGTDKLNTDRYGRDLSWGVAIINRFHVDRDGDGVPEKQYPNYCTPSGAKCQEHAANGGTCSFASATASGNTGLSYVSACSTGFVTASVQSSVSSAVSRVPSSTVKAVASNKPDYSSSAAFSAWLADYCSGIQENSGAAHNINALQDEIIAKGFCDELLDFLEMHQQEVYDSQIAEGETPSGLWQRYPDDYRYVWGILKYMPFFNNSTHGRAIKYAEYIVAGCMEVIMLPAIGDYAMNDLMNQWSAITAIITNVKNHPEANDPDTLDNIYAMLEARGAELIDNCILKLRDFKLDDGTFVYTYAGKSLATIYGVPISLGVREGDVNGNSLCSSYYRGMFNAFGYKEVPLCTAADGENFLETLYSLDPIIKIPQPVAETIDFEDAVDVSELTRVTLDKKTPIGEMYLTADPEDSTNTALYFVSGVGEQYGDYLKFTPTGTGGNCNIAEFNFLLESADKDTTLFQVKCGDAYMMTIGKSGNYLTFGSVTTTGTGNSETLVSAADKISASEWCKVRIEMYDSEDGTTPPTIKLFINDELKAVTHMFYNSHSSTAKYNHNFSVFQFYSMKAVTTKCYFDDVYCNKENKVFDIDSDDTSDTRG